MDAAAAPDPLLPDLGAVERLCRLALVARRLGGRIRIVDPDPRLRELIALAGIHEQLLGPSPDRPDLP